MSGQAAFDEPVRPAALCTLGAAGKKESELCEEKELNGIREERNDTSDEGGDRMEDEGEFAAPDWRVRAGPRNKPSQREREEHEATHMPFRDWCVHCMMGRGRTHHHIAKQKSEDESRRPIIAMDYFFMKMEATPSAQSIPEESITCVAVKEDRHQSIMSRKALKKGVEEPWAVERVVKFIDLLGYREITLKSDTEPAIIAFRNRVAALCKAEVATEDAVKGDNESNGLIENAVMLLRGIIRTSVTLRVERKNHLVTSLQSYRGWWSTPGASCPGARKVVMERRHLRGCTRKSHHKSLFRLERRCWQDESPQNRGTERTPDISMEFGLECETTAQSASLGMQVACSEPEKFGDWNLWIGGTKKPSTM